MVGLAIVALWFTVVAVYLVRQWWVSELAPAREGVHASPPAPLPTAAAGGAVCAPRPAAVAVDAPVAAGAGRPVPALSWRLGVAGSPTR